MIGNPNSDTTDNEIQNCIRPRFRNFCTLFVYLPSDQYCSYDDESDQKRKFHHPTDIAHGYTGEKMNYDPPIEILCAAPRSQRNYRVFHRFFESLFKYENYTSHISVFY